MCNPQGSELLLSNRNKEQRKVRAGRRERWICTKQMREGDIEAWLVVSIAPGPNWKKYIASSLLLLFVKSILVCIVQFIHSLASCANTEILKQRWKTSNTTYKYKLPATDTMCMCTHTNTDTLIQTRFLNSFLYNLCPIPTTAFYTYYTWTTTGMCAHMHKDKRQTTKREKQCF